VDEQVTVVVARHGARHIGERELGAVHADEVVRHIRGRPVIRPTGALLEEAGRAETVLGEHAVLRAELVRGGIGDNPARERRIQRNALQLQ
jgi:hypothetical protein